MLWAQVVFHPGFGVQGTIEDDMNNHIKKTQQSFTK